MSARKLTADVWTRAAIDAFCGGGHHALKIEPMARSLGVSKGSFYWHFRDHAALGARVVAAWEAAQLAQIWGQGPADPQLTSRRMRNYMRSWAQSDAGAAGAMARVDRRSVLYFAEQLAEKGQDAARLPLIYHALQLGFDQLEDSLGPIPQAARGARISLVRDR